MAIGTGERAPDFDLAVGLDERVSLRDFLGRRNLLLVFHPFAFTPICDEEALDLQESLDELARSETDVVLVACEPTATRLAWKAHLGLTFTVASDFWPHGAAARAYGVFDEATGAPVRGTFLIDKSGTVLWTLEQDADTRRQGLTRDPLHTLDDR